MKWITLILLGLLVGCGGSPSHKERGAKSYVVKKESVQKTLFFTGTIQPLRATAIGVPMDGVIESMHYHYGQRVKAHALVATLNSNELQKQYNDTLTDYLKAKDNFSVTQAKFDGTKKLWDAGLLSKNNFLSEKSSLDTARVSLMQATRKLTEMLDKMDEGDADTLSSLSIEEFEKVKEALTGNHNLIRLKAPATGLLLYPPKRSEDKGERLTVGSAVKAGQVFALIGDMSGISIEISVSEIDISNIKPGMKATISGVALGHLTLEGKLVAVNAQASESSNGGLPTFSGVVEVSHLTKEQQQKVKVGMSASIALTIEESNQLLVPIAAIKQYHGETIVQVRAKDGKTSSQRVLTGAAQSDKVVIESGLHENDVVVYG